MATTFAGSYTEYSSTSSYYPTASFVQPTTATAVAQPTPLPTVAAEPPPAPVVPQVPPPSMAGQTWGHIIPITAGYRNVPGRPLEWKVTRGEDGHYTLDTLVSFGWRAEITAGLDVPSMNFAQITANGVIIYDQGGLEEVAPGVTFTFQDGTQTAADPFWEAERGVGEVPAYIHHITVNIIGLPLEPFDDRRPEAWSLLVIDATQALPIIRVENQDQAKIDEAVANYEATGFDYIDPVIASDGYSFAWDPDARYWYTLGQMTPYDDGAGNYVDHPTPDNEYYGYDPGGGSDFVTYDEWNFGRMGGGKRIIRHDLNNDGAVTIIDPNSEEWPLETSIFDLSGTIWRDPYTGDLWLNPLVSETSYPYFHWYCCREVNGFVNRNPPVMFFRAYENAPLGASADWVILAPACLAEPGDPEDLSGGHIAEYAWIERPTSNDSDIVIAQMVSWTGYYGVTYDNAWVAPTVDYTTGDVWVFAVTGPYPTVETEIKLFRIPAPGSVGAGTYITKMFITSGAWFGEPVGPSPGIYETFGKLHCWYLGATHQLLLAIKIFAGMAYYSHTPGTPFESYRYAYGIFDIATEEFEYKGWWLGPMTADFTPCAVDDPAFALYAHPDYASETEAGDPSWMDGYFLSPYFPGGRPEVPLRRDPSRATDWLTFRAYNVVDNIIQVGTPVSEKLPFYFCEVEMVEPTNVLRSFTLDDIDPENTGLADVVKHIVASPGDSIFEPDNLTWVTHGTQGLGNFLDELGNWVEPPDGKPSDNPAQTDPSAIDYNDQPYWQWAPDGDGKNNGELIINFAFSSVEGISLRRWFTLLGELTTHLKGKVTVGSNITDPLDSMYLVDTQTTFNRDALAMCRATNCIMRENLDGVEIIRPVDGDDYTVDHELDEDVVIKRSGTGVTFNPVGEDDLPSKVVLHAIASEASFRWTERPARREQGPYPTTQSDKEESIRIQAGMPINQIQTYASDTLYRLIEAGDQAKMALAWTHAIKIQPGDVIEVPDNGSVHTLMVTKVNRDPNRAASIEAQRIHSVDPPEGIADAGSSPDSPTVVE
jgi:hypothetical protein